MRRYRLRVGLDVDDTLYICNEFALSILREKYGDDPALSIHNIKTWGYQGDISDERIPFFRDPEFVKKQPMYPGAQKLVHDLSKIADVFFVTAVPPECMSVRAARLAEDFPEVPPSNLIFGSRKDIMRLDVLLDDAAHNISTSQASYPVLMRRPWNKHLSGLLSVNSFSDFLHLVRMIRNSFVEKMPDLSRGGVICLIGPSGTGKNKLATALCQMKGFKKPQTPTTRKPNPGEDPNSYRFVSEKEFLLQQDQNGFIETTVYSNHFYGTSASQIDPIVNAGGIAVIPIDICGAVTVKNLYKSKVLMVFMERDKEAILHDIISRKISEEDKVRRIMSIEFENRNAELCDLAVQTDAGINRCIETIINYLNRDKRPRQG